MIQPRFVERVHCRMPLVQLLLAFVVFQIGIRVWLRLSPQPIPFGWTWLLENPWRRSYRDPERTAVQCQIRPTDTVLEVGCGSGLFTRSLATRCVRLIAQDLEPRYLAQTRAKTQDLPHVEFLEEMCVDSGWRASRT
ncbi:MAG: methyltransferase domain-containing protein [Pleurocapsa sp. SU_196_0]|nr:methyltransferase domain-containing protein [Pleurocapsa sp. SU_196_0]